MQALCLQSCMLMNTVSDAVLKLDSAESRNLMLLSQLKKLHLHSKSLRAAFARMYPAEIDESHIEEIRTNYITTFCSLAALLANQLSKLTVHMVKDGNSSRNYDVERRSSGTSPRASIFWVLWDILFASCVSLRKWSSTWPDSTSNPQLHLYLHNLSDWLLTASRQNPKAWTFLKYRDEESGSRIATILLSPNAHCMFSLARQPSHQISHTLSQLPFNYLATLCAVSCELLTNVPRSPLTDPDDSKDAMALSQLATAVGNIHDSARVSDDLQILDRLAVPPVLELFKRALAFCNDRNPDHSSKHGFLDRDSILVILTYLLSHRPTPFQLSAGGRNPAGFADPNLGLQPLSVTPDHRLVFLILQNHDESPLLSECSDMAIGALELFWGEKGTTHDQSAGSLTVLAHRCLTCSLLLMKKHQVQACVAGRLARDEACILSLEQRRRQQWKEYEQQQQREQQECLEIVEQRLFNAMEPILRLMKNTLKVLDKKLQDLADAPVGKLCVLV